MMKLYENVFVTRSDLTEDEVEKLATQVRDMIANDSGEVVSHKYCGVRNLAYDISNNNKGHFYITHFQGDNDLLDNIDRYMKINEDIIRHITVAVPEVNEELKEILIKEKKEFE